MSATQIAAKNAPVVAPLSAGMIALHDPMVIKTGAIILGLIFGAMWRAGSLAQEGRGWKAIRSDMLTSLLIGGANAVLALSLVELLGFGALLAMGVGVIFGATGLKALPEIKSALADYARRRLLGDQVTLVQPKDVSIEAIQRELSSPHSEVRDDNGPA